MPPAALCGAFSTAQRVLAKSAKHPPAGVGDIAGRGMPDHGKTEKVRAFPENERILALFFHFHTVTPPPGRLQSSQRRDFSALEVKKIRYGPGTTGSGDPSRVQFAGRKY